MSNPISDKEKIAPIVSQQPEANPHFPRRRFISTTVGATASALLGLNSGLAAPRFAVQTTLSPAAALNELMEGNQRYLSGKMTAHLRDLELLHAKTAEKQQPFAAVLACADSRVPVEIVFDQTIGDLFVCRIAGNISTAEITASLEYAAAELGVRAILVLGHSKCGAVAATVKGSAVPGVISALYPRIRPAVDLAGPDIEATSKANAKIHSTLLVEASPVIGSLVKEHKIKVVAGYYDVSDGTVTMVA